MKVCILFCCIQLGIILSTESLPEGIREDRNYDDVVSSSSEKIEVRSLNLPSEISKFVNLGLGSEVESDIPRQSLSTRRDRLLDPEVADQLEGNGWLDVIPGTPGKDYPNYRSIPETSFSCDEKTAGGYYADIEARCQVFHVCNTNGEKSSFICPSGSIFNQKYFVCDWWYDFECDDATDLYSLNEKINRGGTGSGPSGPGRILIDNEKFLVDKLKGENFDLSLAGTGEGNIGYLRNKNKNKNRYESNAKVRDSVDNSRGFKNEFLDQRVNYESNNANDDDNRPNEYHRSSSVSPRKNKTEEIITRGSDSRIKKNRNGYRENNYSSGDYLLGIIMENEYPENRSSSHNTIQRRRFLPIL